MKSAIKPLSFARYEPALIEKLLEVRNRLIEADLGDAIATEHWD